MPEPASASRRYREVRGLERRGHIERVYALWSPVYDLVFAGIFARGHRRVLDLLAPQPRERILEVGVGTGLTLRHYPPGATVVGIDISDKMLDKARKRALDLPDLEVHLEKADASKLPYSDHSFDAVLAAYVLTAVEDPYAVCMEIRRVLKPGGRLVTICNSNEPHWFWGRMRRWMAPLFWRMGFTSVLDVPDLLRRCGYELTADQLMEPLKTHRLIQGVVR